MLATGLTSATSDSHTNVLLNIIVLAGLLSAPPRAQRARNALRPARHIGVAVALVICLCRMSFRRCLVGLERRAQSLRSSLSAHNTRAFGTLVYLALSHCTLVSTPYSSRWRVRRSSRSLIATHTYTQRPRICLPVLASQPTLPRMEPSHPPSFEKRTRGVAHGSCAQTHRHATTRL